MAWLEKEGLFRGRAGNAMRLGLCSRSGDVIEPVLKPQWWVACSGMAADACAAVRDGRLQIVPPDFEATWFRCAPLLLCCHLHVMSSICLTGEVHQLIWEYRVHSYPSCQQWKSHAYW